MANNCEYSMCVKGTEENVEEFYKRMTRDYNEGKHFSRIFSCSKGDERKTSDGGVLLKLYGDCAWSIWSCMWKGDGTYYADNGAGDPDRCNIEDTCIELQLEWECHTDEPGMCFREHFRINRDKVLQNVCEDYISDYFHMEDDYEYED